MSAVPHRLPARKDLNHWQCVWASDDTADEARYIRDLRGVSKNDRTCSLRHLEASVAAC